MQTFGSIGFFVPWPSTIKVGNFQHLYMNGSLLQPSFFHFVI